MRRFRSLEPAEQPVTRVAPAKGWQAVGLKELWLSRELLRTFIVRDIKIRYKQTVLGIFWAILQPLVAMVVFTVVLNGAAGVKAPPGIPYPVYTYAGLVIWLYFADSLARASASLVKNNMLLSKIYFPRLLLPLSGVAAPVVDFLAAMAILLLLMVGYGVAIPWTIVLAVPLLAATMICAAAFGIWLAALNVEYRDVGYVVPMAVQLWMFLTPVVYAVSNVHGILRGIYSINPMASIVIMFRWAVLGSGEVDWTVVIPSAAVLLAILAGGVAYFRRLERSFADAI
jgi:lipopolysaccharide transport system permease protein